MTSVNTTVVAMVKATDSTPPPELKPHEREQMLLARGDAIMAALETLDAHLKTISTEAAKLLTEIRKMDAAMGVKGGSTGKASLAARLRASNPAFASLTDEEVLKKVSP